MQEHNHQLAAILFADMVGYTAMMQQDENEAVEKVHRFRETVELIASELNGKIVQYYGDGSLLLFNSSTDAVEFAKLLQEDLSEDPVIPVRIGIHMGDVLLHSGNVFGDVVNIASRIQALAPSGGIYISEMVYRNIANKKEMESEFVKEEKLKNVKEPIRVYEVFTRNSQAYVKPDDSRETIINPAEDKSIAVLPFTNLSSDAEQEYFSDGLTEDIITQLSKIKAYKVISRTSVMQYKNTSKTIKEIGKELGVKLIMEGSVQRSADKVRITSQLINALNDEHLWADSYDRPVKDIFSIQREVALSIASILNTTLSKTETQQLDYIPTVNLSAYDFYLRGKLLVEKRNKVDLLEARKYFQQAAEKDKAFANAYSGLADTFLLSSFRGYEDPTKMLWLAKKNIDVALSLDPFSGETQASLGYWYFQNLDWHAADITYRRALKLNSNQSNIYLWLAILLEAKGEMAEALEIYNKGYEINPMWEYLLQNKIRLLANMNNKEAAYALQQSLIDKASHDPVLLNKRYSDLSLLQWSFDDKEKAIASARIAGNKGLSKFYKDGDFSIMKKKVDEYYQELKKRSEYISQLWMGIDYAYAGDREKALDCFDNAIALKETAISMLLIRDYGFITIKYLNMALITRKIKKLINF
ncbi:MAG TPA: adenylate/guanylate cyclase domain-containing protein [Chitinophagaceae bacterium]|nr:adenylate/guanylate cyclase domain-containing protein [Chitinophagaceae bacterium]